MKAKAVVSVFLLTLISPSAAFAAVEGETAYIFNSLLFLIGGFLVMFMAAGFTMLEAGMYGVKMSLIFASKTSPFMRWQG